MRTVPTNVELPTNTPPIPDPQPVDLQEVDWTVITPDRLPEGSGWVFIALAPTEYEQLSTNQAELLRWIIEAKWRLRYYRGEVMAEQIPPMDRE